MAVHFKIGAKTPGRGRYRVPRKPIQIRAKTVTVAEEVHAIQNREASDIEWAVYSALKSLGWTDDDIYFQVPIQGGINPVGGGQVLDFVVYIGPGRVVIDVRGRQWHGPTAGKSAKDRWREIQAMADPTLDKYIIVWQEVAENWGRLRSLLIREVGAK